MSRSPSPLLTSMSDFSGSELEFEIDEYTEKSTTMDYSNVLSMENAPGLDAVRYLKRNSRQVDICKENNGKKIRTDVETIDNAYPYAHPSKFPISFEQILTTFNALYEQFCSVKVTSNNKIVDDKKTCGKIYFDGLSETFLLQHRNDGFVSVDSPGNDITDWKLLIFIDAIISFMLHRDCSTNKKYQQKQNLICAVRHVIHEIHGVNANDISAADNLVSFNSIYDTHFVDSVSLREYMNLKCLHRSGKSKGKFIAIANDLLETLRKREELGSALHVILNNVVFQICDTYRDISLPCASGRIVFPYAYNVNPLKQPFSQKIVGLERRPMSHLIISTVVDRFDDPLECIKFRFDLINSRLDKIAAFRSVQSSSQIRKVKSLKATKHIRRHVQSGDWCSPGSIVGIYADGIDVPAIDAESFGVVEMVASPDTIVREWSPVTKAHSIVVPAELETAVVQSKSVNVFVNGSCHFKVVDSAIIKHLVMTNSIEVLCINDAGTIMVWDKCQRNVRFIGVAWFTVPSTESPSEIIANLTLTSNSRDGSVIINDLMNHMTTTEEKIEAIEKLLL